MAQREKTTTREQLRVRVNDELVIELSYFPHAGGDLRRTAPERVERVETVSPP